MKKQQIKGILQLEFRAHLTGFYKEKQRGITMVKLYDSGVYLLDGKKILTENEAASELAAKKITREQARQGTIT